VWNICDLRHIHSRRLNYSNAVSWELHIYDQGLVGPGSDYMGPTVGAYGLPVSKFPGKFLVHTPALSGQYPTRDGEGRYVAFYMLLKRMVARCTAQDFERVIRPWVLGYFNRDIRSGELPIASKEDIAALMAALNAFGTGSMNAAALPNSVKVELMRAAAAMSADNFLAFLDRQISIGLLGQAFTTQPGPNGNQSTAETADKNTQIVIGYSAASMADSFREGLAIPWMRLNHPAISRCLAPRILSDVSDVPKPEILMKMAKDGASIDMPIDADDVADRTGLKLLAPTDTTGRRVRVVSPKSGTIPFNDDDNNANPAGHKQDSGIDQAKPNAPVVELVKPHAANAKTNSAPAPVSKPKARTEDNS
jgi:hypothetical protein